MALTQHTAEVQTLKPAEADRLVQLEATIQAGVQTFVEVGLALTEIRNAKLYRATHATFESYCRERWNLSRPHAYRVMSAADVASTLSPTGDISERAIRPLVKLAPEKRAEVWTKAKAAAGDRSVTARHVETAIGEAPELPPNKYLGIVDAFEAVADAATLLVIDLMDENKPAFKLLSHEGTFVRMIVALKALKVAREKLDRTPPADECRPEASA